MRELVRFLALLAVVGGCATSVDPPGVPKSVFVPAGARDLRVSGEPPGKIDVTYVVQDKYPASQTREQLAQALRDSGYHLLDHGFLEPNVKVETPRVWASYVDGRTSHETCVRELVENWQNANGDVVLYGLRYDSTCDPGAVRRSEPTTDTLKVVAAVIPAAFVRDGRESVRKTLPQR